MHESHDGDQQKKRMDNPGQQDPLTRDLIAASKAAQKAKRIHKKMGRKFSKGK